MAVLQDININVHGQPSEKRLQTFLRLSQNENGRMINFRVLGPPLPSGCTATFSGTKPDGNVYSKTGTVAGNFVVIQEDMQMTAVAGVWDAKLDIVNGSHNIMTALIRVVIDADVVDPDAIASDSQLQGLVAEAKYYAEHARTDAYGSPLTAPTKAQMTDHTRVYVYTGSEPNMVAGNWYHWNGTEWISGGVYNAVAVQTDTTLRVAGKAADGKATGDALDALKEDLKEELSALENSVLLEDIPFELQIGSGINPSTGGNYNNIPRYSRTSMILHLSKGVIHITLDSEDYEYVAWVYKNRGSGSGVYSPTNSAYTSETISFEVGPGKQCFRLGIQRKDHAAMTGGVDDPTSDEYKLTNALKIRRVKDDEIARRYEKNISIAVSGGVETPILKNGGLNASSGYVVDSLNETVWSNYAALPMLLFKGDKITSQFAFVVIRVVAEKDGFVSTGSIFMEEGSTFTAVMTGLYSILVQNVTADTDVEAVTSVTHYGIKASDSTKDSSALLRNPYANIAKNKLQDGSYEWSNMVKDLKSTCHLHVTRATHFMRAYNKGYNHLAVSNYHASKPTVPIREIIKTLPSYTDTMVISDSFMESPNAEHVYFSDLANTHVHLNSVGSYETSGADNTEAGEGGFDGTVEDFLEETKNKLKYPNGGGVTINHPYWSGMTVSDILNIMGASEIVFALEIYNAACEALNGKGYSLDLWDEVLSAGVQIFGVAVPDHAAESTFDWENLSFGFNHMLCITETEQEIMLAYRQGRFYTTIANDDLLMRYFGVNASGVMTFKASKNGTITVKTATRSQTFTDVSSAEFTTQDGDIFVRVEMVSGDNRLFTNAIML